jgi:hypothetical protein
MADNYEFVCVDPEQTEGSYFMQRVMTEVGMVITAAMDAADQDQDDVVLAHILQSPAAWIGAPRLHTHDGAASLFASLQSIGLAGQAEYRDGVQSGLRGDGPPVADILSSPRRLRGWEVGATARAIIIDGLADTTL